MPSPRRSRTRKEAEAKGYRSGFELRVAEQLEAVGAEFEYEPKDAKLTYDIRETRVYLPDFRLPNGIIIECKGRLTAADRKKLKLVKAQHPDKEIRLVFMYDNKLNPRSKTRYSAWAEQHGFQWALKEVPIQWIGERLRDK